MEEGGGSWGSRSSDFRCWVRVIVWELLTGAPTCEAESSSMLKITHTNATHTHTHTSEELTPKRLPILPYGASVKTDVFD